MPPASSVWLLGRVGLTSKHRYPWLPVGTVFVSLPVFFEFKRGCGLPGLTSVQSGPVACPLIAGEFVPFTGMRFTVRVEPMPFYLSSFAIPTQ